MNRRSKRARNPFERLAAAHMANAAGDTLIAIALAGTLFFDVPTVEARTRVALYLLLTMAPFALLAPLIGPLMDRWQGAHRLTVMSAGAGRAGLAVFMTSTVDTLLLYPAAFGVLVLSRAHSVARSALVPAVLDPGSGLVTANARLTRLAVVGSTFAAGPGILAHALGGPGATLVIAASAFIVTAVIGSALPGGRDERTRRRKNERTPIVLAIRLRRALIVNYVMRASGGFLLLLLAFELRRRNVEIAGFALVLGASGLGAFIGASIVPRLRRGGNEEWVLVTSLLVGAGAAVIAVQDFGTDFAALMGASVGMLGNAGRLALDSIAQRSIPESARGRVFSRFETGLQLFWVLGALPPAVVAIPIEPGLWAACATFALTALWFLTSLGAEGRRSLAA